MLNKHYKLVCWLIWLIGYSSIALTWFFSQDHMYDFLSGTLLSSWSFAALAIYTKKVFENKKLNPYQKNINFFEIAGGGVF